MTIIAPLPAMSAAQTLVTTDGLELAYTVLSRRSGSHRAEDTTTPVIWIEGFGGCWAAELDQLSSSASVISLNLGACRLEPFDKITPCKIAQAVQELANALQLATFSVVAAAGAGIVALACAKLIPPHRLCSVGVIAGLGAPASNSGTAHVTKWFCWDAQQLPWLALFAARLTSGELVRPLPRPELASPSSWSALSPGGRSTPSPERNPEANISVSPASLTAALTAPSFKLLRKNRVQSEASLSTMSLPVSPKNAAGGQRRPGVDRATLADASLVDVMRTALLEGLKERQAEGIDEHLALTGGLYRRPLGFKLDEMVEKVLAWTVDATERNPVEMGRINRRRLTSSQSRGNLQNLPSDDTQLSLGVDHTTIIIEQLVLSSPEPATAKNLRTTCDAPIGPMGVAPVVPTSLVTVAR